ncbi:MAG: hypothetical protein FWE23_08915 [Chitinivibrionia bacterium]|nr:hypothetical protein [Chitinivibrionia bacterium]
MRSIALIIILSSFTFGQTEWVNFDFNDDITDSPMFKSSMAGLQNQGFIDNVGNLLRTKGLQWIERERGFDLYRFGGGLSLSPLEVSQIIENAKSIIRKNINCRCP